MDVAAVVAAVVVAVAAAAAAAAGLVEGEEVVASAVEAAGILAVVETAELDELVASGWVQNEEAAFVTLCVFKQIISNKNQTM